MSEHKLTEVADEIIEHAQELSDCDADDIVAIEQAIELIVCECMKLHPNVHILTHGSMLCDNSATLKP